MTKDQLNVFPPRVLSIAGSDSGGSAGIQADLKSFTARGVFGMTAITLATAQNTQGVHQLQSFSEVFIAAQIDAVLDDIGVSVIKTGLLLKPEIIDMVAQKVDAVPLVVDPVLVNGAGKQIVSDAAIEHYKKLLFPKATIITPNIDETKLLSGVKTLAQHADFAEAAQRLYAMGMDYILIKGSSSTGATIANYFYDGQQLKVFEQARLPIENPHGIGCTLASAIAAEIAKGNAVPQAVKIALDYVHRALAGALDWQIGNGRSPVNHFVDMQNL